ncbi:MAG: 2-dehydropantoate 2-reductase [Eubacteriales bacterium]|nr:2-dehydropantoate 2-reductase [Eubacteriales bacterium]
MKIAIIGAGAMGCLYGAYLSRNNEVTMIDSYEPQVRAINEHGISVTECDGSVVRYPDVRACLSGECNEQPGLVILFVKSTYSKAALDANRALFGPGTIVMTLQNGAGNDRMIAGYADAKNIIIGTTKHNCVNLGNGCCRHSGVGLTTIGSNHDSHDILETAAALFNESGLETDISDDIQRIIWSKLFVNLSINTFTAITETPIGYMLENKYAWDFAKRLVYEAVDVAEEDGTYFDRREVLESVRQVCEAAKDGYSSMYQDRKRGVRTEIDAINGAIVEQAKIYGVPVPYNSLIVDLIHAMEGADAYRREKEG